MHTKKILFLAALAQCLSTSISYAACTPATAICVTRTTDHGNVNTVGTLAWAITQANLTPNSTIAFDPLSSLGTVNATTNLPALTSPTTILGRGLQTGETLTNVIKVTGPDTLVKIDNFASSFSVDAGTLNLPARGQNTPRELHLSNGATLQAQRSEAGGGQALASTFGQNIVLDNGGVINHTTASTTDEIALTGTIQGTGSLTTMGGRISLSGVQTNTGGLNVRNSRITLTSTARIAGPITITAGSQIINSSTALTPISISGAGLFTNLAPLRLDADAVSAFTGEFTNSSTLTLTGDNVLQNASRFANSQKIIFEAPVRTQFSGTLSSTSLTSNATVIDKTGPGDLLVTGTINAFRTNVLAGRIVFGNGEVDGNYFQPTIGTSEDITREIQLSQNTSIVFNNTSETRFTHRVQVTDDTLGNRTIVQAGPGRLVVTNSVKENVGFQIDPDAILAFGDGSGALPQPKGPILNNGTLELNYKSVSAIPIAGQITGTGNIVQTNGAGFVHLLANNSSFQGNYIVERGSLHLINADMNALPGDIIANGAINLNLPSLSTYAGKISGTGSVRQDANAPLTLIGDSSAFTGTLNINKGSVIIGDGSTNGTINPATVSISAGSELIFDRSDDYNFRATIITSGDIVKRNTNTTTLTADTSTSWTGHTRVEAGVLQLGIDAPSQVSRVHARGSFSIAEDATLVLNRSNTYQFTNQFSGTGQLVHSGSGLTVLYADNSFSGTTTIANGEFRLGDNTETGWINGDIVNNASLSFSSSIDRSFDGDISGTGSIFKRNANTVTLVGDNQAFTGNTLVADGTLQLGNGAQASRYGGNIVNRANLRFNTNSDVSYEGRFSGEGTLEKLGTGEVTLTGDNSAYTGQTTVSAGTLQLGDGGTTGLLGGAIVNNANLTLNLSGNVDVTNTLTGTGNTTFTGSGHYTLADNSQGFSGRSLIDGADLRVNGTLGGTLDILNGTLHGNANVGSVLQQANGIISPGNSIGHININGDWTINGGLVQLETTLGDDNSPTDTITVTGNTSGFGTLHVVNFENGQGAPTNQGIRLIEVQGQSDADFTLLGDYTFKNQPAVVGGAYAYRLYKGLDSDPSDGNWYLRSALINEPAPPVPPVPPAPLYQPAIAVYGAYASSLLDLSTIGTLRDRTAGRQWSGDTTQGQLEGLWGRIEGRHAKTTAHNDSLSLSSTQNSFRLQSGIDTILHSNDQGILVGGVNLRYATGATKVDSAIGSGAITTEALGLGATLTWYDNSGFYLDAQGQVTWFNSDLSSDQLGSLAQNNSAVGYGLSLEAGQEIDLGDGLKLIPQAQLSYTSAHFAGFDQVHNGVVRARLNDGSTDSLVARLGVAIEHEQSWQEADGTQSSLKLHGIANIKQELLSGSSVNVSGTPISTNRDTTWVGIGVGAAYTTNDGNLTIFGEATVDTSLQNFGNNLALGAKVGFKARF